jgi:hypothetical protein
MPKSEYPNKLDTSVQIPAVRDNITEIGSDVLNSLRDAIFNIERTLGVNPQGSAGSTLASRLSNLIDQNGNIKKEALDRVGILSGPISDSDISKSAGIKEFKLNLDYPTNLLQDEISILDTKIEQFTKAIEELNRIISIHVNESAVNRHRAGAITVETATVSPSDNALSEVPSGSLQSLVESIFNNHIYYSGAGISGDNNSHRADQVFFDNKENSDIIFSSSVQGAIDDLANLEGEGIRSSVLNLNSNGRIRTGSTVSAYEGLDSGEVLVGSRDVSYLEYLGISRSIISFSSPATPSRVVERFDILEISGSTNDSDNRSYYISDILLDPSDDITGIEVFGGPSLSSSIGTSALIKKASYGNYNQNGLNCSVRPRALFTNNPVIQVALPNSAAIVSSGSRFEKLEPGLYENIAIDIDDLGPVEIPLYNAAYDRQTIDTVIATMNRHCVSNNLNIFAYKLRALNCYELAISHNIPDFESDIKKRSIKIVEAASLDAADILGLSYMIDRTVSGSFGNNFHINGKIVSDFGLVKKYDGETISLSNGLAEIESSAINFLDQGVRSGDLCVIDNSSDELDDGSYIVKEVESNRVLLDYTGNTFSGSIDENSAVLFIRSSCPISELNFLEPSASILIDIFADENLDIFYQRRMDISGEISLPNLYLVIEDISKGFITKDESYTLSIDSDGMATLTNDVTLLSGKETFVGSTGNHRIFSPNGMEFVLVSVFVPNESLAILPPGSISITLVGALELPDSVLHLSRCTFSPEFGTVIDDINSGLGGLGAPSVIDKRISGTVDDTVISEPFIERYIWGPRNELRSGGVIRGIFASNLQDDSGTASVDVDPGVCLVSGSRFEYLGDLGLKYDYSGGATNNFYIGISSTGCIVTGNEVDKSGGTNYVSPFSYKDTLHIAYIDIDGAIGSPLTAYDTRFFIDRSDYKISNNIIVSEIQSFGHFTDLKSAVDYCRMYSKIYRDCPTPSILIREGTYDISETIVIDFDLSIKGSGNSSVIKRSDSFALTKSNLETSSDSDSVFLIGNISGDDIQYGVNISDITYVGLEGQGSTVAGTVLSLQHASNGSSSFAFNNIRFIPASSYNAPALADVSGGGGPNEQPFIIGSGNGNLFENILINNCLFSGMGYNKGIITLDSGNQFNNISALNNISVESIDVASGYTMIRDSSGGSSVLNNVQEINSMITQVIP